MTRLLAVYSVAVGGECYAELELQTNKRLCYIRPRDLISLLANSIMIQVILIYWLVYILLVQYSIYQLKYCNICVRSISSSWYFIDIIEYWTTTKLPLMTKLACHLLYRTCLQTMPIRARYIPYIQLAVSYVHPKLPEISIYMSRRRGGLYLKLHVLQTALKTMAVRKS